MPNKPLARCPQCKKRHTGSGRCEACRGSADARGYGPNHRALRAQLRPTVEAGLHDCSRCSTQILPGQAWALDHDDDDRRRYRGVSHAACNSGAARKG